jgi:uncharacterized protein (TIGR02611 family)
MGWSTATRALVHATRRVVVTVVGFALLAVGLAGMVLPVLPGWLLILAALAMLATEYSWARLALESARRRAVSTSRWARHSLARRRAEGQPPRSVTG